MTSGFPSFVATCALPASILASSPGFSPGGWLRPRFENDLRTCPTAMHAARKTS